MPQPNQGERGRDLWIWFGIPFAPDVAREISTARADWTVVLVPNQAAGPRTSCILAAPTKLQKSSRTFEGLKSRCHGKLVPSVGYAGMSIRFQERCRGK